MIWILIIGLALLVLVSARYWYVPFLLNPNRINLKKLGFKITVEEHEQQVKAILNAFFCGFNAMLAEKGMPDVRAKCDAFPKLLRPFAHEGAATAYPVRAIFSRRHRVRDFEREMEALSREYFLMYDIGVGFWCGMVYKSWPSFVTRTADKLDPFYKYLCYDGFGFKLGLFHYLRAPGVVNRFFYFNGYARHACFQGFGRSLWFLFMDAPGAIGQSVSRLDAPYRGDCYSGLGLAVAFTNTDDLRVAFEFSNELDPEYLIDYFLGMIIALYTRRAIDADYLNECLEGLETWQKSVALEGLRSCDDRFVEVAASHHGNHYEQWRASVRADLGLIVAPRATGTTG